MMFDLDAVEIEIKLIPKEFFSVLKKNGFSLCFQMDSTDKSFLADYTKRKELNILYTFEKDIWTFNTK